MRTGSRVMNTGRAKRRLRAYGREAEKAVKEIVLETALGVEGGYKRRVQKGPASGRVYKKTNPRRIHRASAPGEAPATDTGGLVSSINHEIDLDGLGASVGSGRKAARHLELGTQTMAARPAAVPATEEQRPKSRKRIRTALVKARRKATRKR